MILPDVPKRCEIDSLEQNDLTLLDSVRNRVASDLTDLARIVLRSISVMTPVEKQ
jgi:hypothetical protein